MYTSLPLFKRAPTFACYLAGLLIYCGSLSLSATVNPRDMVNGSWADPSLRFTMWAGVALCMMAPLLSTRPFPARLAFCFLGLLPLCVVWYRWWALTA